MIESIGSIGSIFGPDFAGVNQNLKTGANEVTGASFSDILAQAIGGAVDADVADQQGQLALLAGLDTEPTTSMTESTKAELTLNLAIQIRNKVLDAYTEIMRMSV